MTIREQERQTPSDGGARTANLSYIILADPDQHRTATCLDAARPYKLGAIVVRTAAEAIRQLDQFGVPRLLIVDLTLPGDAGFEIVDALRKMGGETPVIAWAASRELREFAVSRFAGGDVRVLSGSAAAPVVRAAVARALDGEKPVEAAGDGATGESRGAPLDAAETTPESLAERAREICGAPGIAVYLQSPGQKHLRACTWWTSSTPQPDVVDDLPVALNRILETGKRVALPEGAASVPSALFGALTVEGVFGVPIFRGDRGVVGAICVFDAKPLTLTAAAVQALEMLGGAQSQSTSPSSAPAPVESSPPIAEGASAVVLDRRSGDLAIARELARVRREQRPLSVILLGVRSRQASNGASDERARDPEPMAAVSAVLPQAVRAEDLAISWTPDSILIVLPGHAAPQARQVAERVRAVLQAGARDSALVAGGVAEMRQGESFEDLVTRANERVQAARERGHSRVG